MLRNLGKNPLNEVRLEILILLNYGDKLDKVRLSNLMLTQFQLNKKLLVLNILHITIPNEK